MIPGDVSQINADNTQPGREKRGLGRRARDAAWAPVKKSAQAFANTKVGGAILRSKPVRLILRGCHIVDRFLHEVNHDHRFWVNTLGMKGGAGTALLAATFGLTYALTFPFAIAATLVAGCAALIGLGVLAAVTGFGTFREKARAAFYKARGLPPPPPKPPGHRNFLQKIGDSKAVRWLADTRLVKAVGKSKPWDITKKIVRHQQHNVLSGFAVGGAVLSTTMGVFVLSAQVVVLPVVVVGSLLTVASVWALTTIATGVAGTFFSVKNVMKLHREKKEEKLARLAQDDMPREAPAPAADKAAAADFRAAAQPPVAQEAAQPPVANDNAQVSAPDHKAPGRKQR